MTKYWNWAATAFFVFVALWFGDRLVKTLAERLRDKWDGQRLAPVFAVYHGYRLYPNLGEGPNPGYTYGPVSVWAYWPVVVAPDPTWALAGSYVLTLIYSFGPVLGLLWLSARGGVRPWSAALLGLLLFAILTRDSSLGYSTASPVHDAVALGLGLLASLPLLRRSAVGWGALMLSAAWAVLAVAAKQNAVFYLPSLVLYCALALGRKAAVRYVALLTGLGLLLVLVLFAIYRPGPLAYYLFTVQGRMPIRTDKLGEFIRTLGSLSLLSVLLIVSALYLKSAAEGEDVPSAALRDRLARNPWVLPLLIALGDLPISLLGVMKLGGDWNCFSYTLYFLAAAASSLATDLLAHGVAHSPALGRRAGRVLVVLALTQWLWGQIYTASVPFPFRWSKFIHMVRANPNQVVFDYSKQHPGTAYFPWNTLAVVMAERRLDSSEDALLYSPPPGFRPTDPYRGADIPRAPEYIAFPPDFDPKWGRNTALQIFPDYRRRVEVHGLPHFGVFARGKQTDRSP